MRGLLLSEVGVLRRHRVPGVGGHAEATPVSVASSAHRRSFGDDHGKVQIHA